MSSPPLSPLSSFSNVLNSAPLAPDEKERLKQACEGLQQAEGLLRDKGEPKRAMEVSYPLTNFLQTESVGRRSTKSWTMLRRK